MGCKRGLPQYNMKEIIMTKSKKVNKIQWSLLDFLEMSSKEVVKSCSDMAKYLEEQLSLALQGKGAWKVTHKVSSDTSEPQWSFTMKNKKNMISLDCSVLAPCFLSKPSTKDYSLRFHRAEAYFDELDDTLLITSSECIPLFIKRGEMVVGNYSGIKAMVAEIISSYTDSLKKIEYVQCSPLIKVSGTSGCSFNFESYSAKIARNPYGYKLITLLEHHFSNLMRQVYNSPSDWRFCCENTVQMKTDLWWNEKLGELIATHYKGDEVVEISFLLGKTLHVSVSKWKKPEGDMCGEFIVRAKKKVLVNKQTISWTFVAFVGDTNSKHEYDDKAWSKVIQKSLSKMF